MRARVPCQTSFFSVIALLLDLHMSMSQRLRERKCSEVFRPADIAPGSFDLDGPQLAPGGDHMCDCAGQLIFAPGGKGRAVHLVVHACAEAIDPGAIPIGSRRPSRRLLDDLLDVALGDVDGSALI